MLALPILLRGPVQDNFIMIALGRSAEVSADPSLSDHRQPRFCQRMCLFGQPLTEELYPFKEARQPFYL